MACPEPQLRRYMATKYKKRKTMADLIKDLADEGHNNKSPFLKKFFEYVSEHVISAHWKDLGFSHIIMESKVGSFVTTAVDK